MSTINRDIPRPTAQQREPWSHISAATAHEAMGRRGAVHSAIKPIGEGMRIVGPAITCICEPGDNLTLHAAMKIAKPGDVIVCDAGGLTEQGLFGDMMATSAQRRGIAGLVVDGGVRDVANIRKMGFPIFSRSISIKGTVKETLGPVNIPIVFAGVLVNPGDLVVADDDGVCIVPLAEIEGVTAAAIAREEKEARNRELYTAEATTWDVSKWGERLTRKGIKVDL